ncbi:MAG: molybdate ABC transporter substrate-binding protein [Sphingomonadaceae bacterium]|nr:molybdate ABC transporter substrate-binding protein [Sphingomonadaceae bacterium]
MFRETLIGLAGTASMLGAGAAADAKPPLVLAAASLQESLNAAADAWASKGHDKPVISFAGSSALAKQIEAGAPADIFISADEPWMDEVQSKGLIDPASRTSFLANHLVLIAPAASKASIAIKPGFDLAGALGQGRLAMADPAAVPAGKYGKEALTKLGVWDKVSAQVASAENVRAALALVERGEAPFGIVYATDALASKQVRVVATFPDDSHAPITYPIAILKAGTSGDDKSFEAFLTSPAGKAIFKRYGFAAR